MRLKSWSLAMLFAVAVFCPLSFAQNVIPDTPGQQQDLRNKLEQGRIGIVTGGPGGTYIRLGSDISRLMQTVRGDNLRVIVQEGRGSVSNLRDLSFLKYVDLALVQADVLSFLRESDPQDYDYLASRIGYIASFHPEIVHIVARGGPFNGPEDLAGKRIAIGSVGSGTQITAPNIISRVLGIDAQFVDMHQQEAFSKLLSGDPDIDAMVYVSGRGSSIFTGIPEELRANVQKNNIYFVPIPDLPPSQSPYIQTELYDKDYDKLIGLGETVKVWAVPAVLAAYNWQSATDRHRRLVEFIDTFFTNKSLLDDGAGGYNDNWCFIDLSAKIGGWERIPAVDNWLQKNRNFNGLVCASKTSQTGNAVVQEAKNCGAFVEYIKREGITMENPNLSAFFKLWKSGNSAQC